MNKLPRRTLLKILGFAGLGMAKKVGPHNIISVIRRGDFPAYRNITGRWSKLARNG